MDCKHKIIHNCHRCNKCPEYKTCEHELKGVYNAQIEKHRKSVIINGKTVGRDATIQELIEREKN